MNYISYICSLIGLVLVGIWLAQEFTTLRVLDSPATGVTIFLLIGFILRMLARRKAV